ncbi:MAG: DUF4091 domain-containing protein [Enterococcus lemanii]
MEVKWLEDWSQTSAWQNETAYAYFCVKASEQVAYQVTTSNLGKDEHQLFYVASTQAHIGRGTIWGEIPAVPKETYQDLLRPVDKETVFTETSQLFCLATTFKKAGEYQRTIILKCQNNPEIAFSLNQQVLPLSLPERKAFSLELWQYPFAVARYYQIPREELFQMKHLEKIQESLRPYQEAGGETIVATIVHDPWNHQTYDAYPSLIQWKKQADQFVFDFTWFDRYVTLNLEMGIQQKIKCFSLLPWADKIAYYDEKNEQQIRTYPVGSKKWQDLWRQFLTAFTQHLEEKNWFDRTYIAIDERSAEEIQAVIDLLAEFPHQKTGERLKISCAMDYQSFDEQLLDQIDDLAIGQSHLGQREHFQKMCQRRREKGLFTSIYNCVGDYPAMFLASHPLESRWLPWYYLSYESDGFLRWALDAWPKDPLQDGSHWYWESGDPFLIYPHQKNEQAAYLSVRFQQLTRGLNDVNKYLYLKNTSARLVKPLTSDLNELVSPPGATNTYGARVAQSTKNEEQLAKMLQQLTRHLQRLTQQYLKEQEENDETKSINSGYTK